MKIKIKIVSALCLLIWLFPSIATAAVPYSTWYMDPLTWRPSMTQHIYVPYKVIDGNKMDIPLSSPRDLFITADNHVYVADTRNNRIVELDEEGNYIRSIGQEEGPGRLNQPEGIFVDKDGTIYVANTGDRTVVKYFTDGRLDRIYSKPESNYLYDDYYFLPSKLVVDQRGVMYIVVKDSFQGILRMNPAGEFTGFFGANKTKLTWLDRLKRAILSKEQLAKEAAKRPNAIENVTITHEGFLITTSSGNVSDGQIKKLNAGGADAFQNKVFREWQLADSAIDHFGFIYAINRETGYITIYDPNGSPMFYFGGGESNARQLGIIGLPTSIALNSNQDIWVADGSLNLIHVFKRTSFGETFLTAVHLYYEGEYAESKLYWEEVIRQNGMLNIALNGMGKIALNEGDYAAAMSYFKQSFDAGGYSTAYWNVRYDWIRNNLLIAVTIMAAGIWGIALLLRRWRTFARTKAWPAWARQVGSEMKAAIFLIFHPYEGYYRLKERKISWLVLALILSLVGGVRILSIFSSGFISYPYDLARVNIKLSIGLIIIPWITWVIANYLVSSIKGGEGRFREVLQASTFALVPYIVMTIPAILISHVLVLEEWVVIDLLNQVMWIWIMLLFLVMTQVTHNFDFLESIKNAGITLFTIAVIWIFVVIIAGLGVNLFDFLKQVYREVTFHG